MQEHRHRCPHAVARQFEAPLGAIALESFQAILDCSAFSRWRESRDAYVASMHALAPEPNSAYSLTAYAMMLSFGRRHDEALATIQRARELDPWSTMINTNLGRVLCGAGRFDEGVAQLEWGVRHAPESVVAHHRLGIALEAVSRFDDAIREFEIALQLSADAPAPMASRARGRWRCTSSRRASPKYGWRWANTIAHSNGSIAPSKSAPTCWRR